MTNASAARRASARTPTDLYAAIAGGSLPAVSYVKPSGLVDGHPASSKLNLFEGFAKKIVDAVKANPTLWADTAIFVTFDEGGGYYDFGLCAAAGLLRRRHAHSDDRRVEIFAGRPHHPHLRRPRLDRQVHRVQLEPGSDHHAQPRQSAEPGNHGRNPYVPVNSPAIGDLVDLFQF